MKKDWLLFFSSKKFQKIMFYLGILFVGLSLFIAFKPDAFEKFGYFGVFVFSIFGAGSVIVAAMARHMDIFLLTLAATLGIGVLDTIQWLTGKNGIAVVEKSQRIQNVERLIKKYGAPILFIMAMIPWPYDFVSLLAGYLGFTYPRFLIPTLAGNYIRVLTIAVIILFFLPR